MRKKKILIKLFLWLSFAALIIFTSRLWLPLPGKYLIVEDNLQKADCIVTLRGDDYWRFKKAVELYKLGYAKNIVAPIVPEKEGKYRDYYNFDAIILSTKTISVKEFALRAFAFFGMDTKNVYFTDQEVASTYDEAVATRKFMQEKGMKSLILVTTSYSTRRALMTFRWVLKGTGIKIYNCTAVNELLNPPQWWAKERDARIVLQEYLTIAYNIFYRFVLHKGKTPFDS